MSRAQDSACLNELVPCLQYIKSKKTPSRDCCDPLKSLIKSDPGCLCSMLGGSSATKQAKVNMTEAMFLPVRGFQVKEQRFKLRIKVCESRWNDDTVLASPGSDCIGVDCIICLRIVIFGVNIPCRIVTISGLNHAIQLFGAFSVHEVSSTILRF
ncbi:uncharacterized protein A4U43_C04F24300 [Asparagus officinalis]|uniref:Bifunctional inhibitor/plant lipid transfer protein/seed storage helical domain-containing protein n=1 Tax=Asparagus officinalis TaxID=4686 RepID=A0A5P1F404_ASPOF|nr:uncharacterized protein A4U43_C04F24300 [Asparagus officinalis]